MKHSGSGRYIGPAAMLLLAACASTEFKSTWKDPAYDLSKVHKVLVMGVGPKETTQKLLEDAFSSNLARKKVQGVPSYAVAAASAKLDEAAWKRVVDAQGMDAVLVSRLVDVKPVEAETASKSPGDDPYNAGWYGFYGRNDLSETPGIHTYAVIYTKLFDAKTGKVVWSAISDTRLSKETPQLAREFAELVVDTLYKP
jgi:hypothetical protein